jgi:glycosyltransferase involved in cell wall biosynthesis
MRIGYDAKRAFKNFTGLGNYSRSLINMMFDFFPVNNYYLYTPPYNNSLDCAFLDKNNVNVRMPKGLWRFFHSIWRSFGLSAQIKRDNIDIYHGLSHELPVKIRRTGAKSIVTMHDLIILRYPHLYSPIDRWIYMRKYRAACKNADLIIAISKQTQDDLVNLMNVNPNKIRLMYQACNRQFYRLCDDDEKLAVKLKYKLPDKYILSVGTIEERKNLLSAIKALAQLPDEIHLVAVGKATNYMKCLYAEINNLHLQGRVHFIHNAEFACLPAIYQQALAFVYISVFEGFGIPVLEALNSQIPVVASNSSSIPEVGGDAALYIDAYDDNTLAQHLNKIINDKELRNAMIRSGIKQSERFKEEHLVKELSKLYDELMSL